MVDARFSRIESKLAGYYASQCEDVSPGVVEDLARAMVAEDARADRSCERRAGAAAFVADQVRYIPAWTWAAQAVLVALMCAVALASGDARATKVAVGVLSAATVLVGVPTVQSSKLNGVAELEYSCPNNAASVMVARLIALGSSSALAVALMVGAAAASLNVGAFAVSLWACPPFFCSCAGSLAILRKAAPSMAAGFCAAWTMACSAVLGVLAAAIPETYAQASLAVWAAAAAAALVWVAREVAMTYRSVSAGLDTFAPQTARTYN